MLPDVQAFHEAIDKAQTVCNTDGDFGKRSAARVAAWDKLAQSEDKLVAYIGDHYRRDYRDEALILLDALPLDVDGIEALGEEHNWCSVLQTEMSKWEAAGALPGQPELSPERAALRSWFVDQVSTSRTHRAKLNELVDAIVAAEAKAPADAVAGE